MKRPTIAITPLYDHGRDSYWMLPGYMKAVEQAGGIPIMLPLTSEEEILDTAAGQYDGFLFTGGQDIAPALYGAEPSPLCGELCPRQDAMERALLERLIPLDKPVLGICRGLQIINAVLGGTLYQDLPAEHPSGVEHRQRPPYDQPIHSVTLAADGPLCALLGCAALQVNSYHHQAVKSLSGQLSPMAHAGDGLIEAVFRPQSRFLWAVQWHPEFSYARDENSLRIFREFVRNAALEPCKEK